MLPQGLTATRGQHPKQPVYAGIDEGMILGGQVVVFALHPVWKRHLDGIEEGRLAPWTVRSKRYFQRSAKVSRLDFFFPPLIPAPSRLM